MATLNGAQKVRSVDEYIAALVRAHKSKATLEGYRAILGYFAAFIGVAIDKLHENMNPEDVMKWADVLNDGKRSSASRSKYLAVVARFMKLNGVAFDELDLAVVKSSEPDEDEGEPLTLDLAQKMMDTGDAHTRALITFLCSTGCRAGETSKLLLSDVGRIDRRGVFVPDINGSVVNVRNAIAKRKRGGLVFLTVEAREFMSLWLHERDNYIRLADAKGQNLRKGSTGRTKGAKHTGEKITRPANDQRLFACSYYTLAKKFRRLYESIDGKKDKYGRATVVPHRCRAFFRTNGANSMTIDLVEGIMRHSGYLNQAYMRMTPAERENAFRAGEHSLYITRKDHRIQSETLTTLEQENAALRERIAALEQLRPQSADTVQAALREQQRRIDELNRMVMELLPDSTGVKQ